MPSHDDDANADDDDDDHDDHDGHDDGGDHDHDHDYDGDDDCHEFMACQGRLLQCGSNLAPTGLAPRELRTISFPPGLRADV